MTRKQHVGRPSDETKETLELRERARQLRAVMDQALKTARELPPLWGITAEERQQPCATCGEPAASYKKVEGQRVYICGPCALREMDEWEASHPS